MGLLSDPRHVGHSPSHTLCFLSDPTTASVRPSQPLHAIDDGRPFDLDLVRRESNDSERMQCTWRSFVHDRPRFGTTSLQPTSPECGPPNPPV
eukprot:m.423990 g.423990  ORF g.423990 m.423990 type:complete len:93 (-) comp44282_c0_seq1:65-343(-)